MSIKLGTNISSLNAQRRLGEAGSALSQIYERLSSGRRISRASDDAAGLAIAEDLNSRSRVYAQAVKNGNDGISLLNIADSAVDVLTSVVVRIRELSEQAASGTFSNTQRKAIDEEAQALSKEYVRITQSTTFNGIKLFDGSLSSGVRLQLGYAENGSINASIGGAVGTGAFADPTRYDTEGTYSNSVRLGDLNGDGVLDLVTGGYDSSSGKITIRLGLGNGQFGAASTYTSEGVRTQSVHVADFNSDGVLDLISAGFGGGSGKVTVRIGNGDGSFGAASTLTSEATLSNNLAIGDLNNDGNIDIVTTGWDGARGKTTVRLGNGDGTFGSSTTYSAEGGNSYNLTLGDLNNDGNLDLFSVGYDAGGGKATIRLGTGNGSFGAASTITAQNGIENLQLIDLNSDGNLDYAIAGSNVGGKVAIALGLGDGSFGAVTVYTSDLSVSYGIQFGDFNGDGNWDLLSAGGNGADGTVTLRLGNGTGTFGAASVFTTEAAESYNLTVGDLNNDGVLDMVTAGTAGGSGQATVRLSTVQEGLGSLLGFSLKSRADARLSMGMLDNTLQNLSKQRGVIGAAQSRVGIAIQNLESSNEQFRAAESRIRDADIAADSANLVRTQILQQAATAVLAQANQAPALALTLLQK